MFGHKVLLPVALHLFLLPFFPVHRASASSPHCSPLLEISGPSPLRSSNKDQQTNSCRCLILYTATWVREGDYGREEHAAARASLRAESQPEERKRKTSWLPHLSVASSLSIDFLPILFQRHWPTQRGRPSDLPSPPWRLPTR